MIFKLHHVGIVCSAEQSDVLRRFIGMFGVLPNPIVRYLPVFGCTCIMVGMIEFIIPDVGSKLDKYLIEQGRSSIHHIAIHVDDIVATCAKLTAFGYKLVTVNPVEGVGGILVNFIHPIDTGIMVELVQI